MRISVDGALLGIISILGIYDGIRLLSVPSFTPEPLGPGAYLIVLSTMLLFAVAVETVLQPPARLRANRVRSKRLTSFFRNPLAQAFLGLFLYAFLLKPVGYFLSTLCFLVVSVRIFGERRWIWVIVSGSGLTIVFYMLFRKLAGVPLP